MPSQQMSADAAIAITARHTAIDSHLAPASYTLIAAIITRQPAPLLLVSFINREAYWH